MESFKEANGEISYFMAWTAFQFPEINIQKAQIIHNIEKTKKTKRLFGK